MAEKISQETDDQCCTVCLEEYKSPRLLPCSHTYCESCLEGILKQSGTTSNLTCPQCRAQHQVPAGGPKAFLTDLAITQDIEAKKWYKQMSTKQSTCGVCEHKGVTISYCPQCEAFLCSYCAGAHKRMKVFSSHEIVPAIKYVGFKPKPKPINCRLHSSCMVTFYCSTCNQLICNECVVGTGTADWLESFVTSNNHSGHKLYTLTIDSEKTIEAKLDKAVEEAKTRNDKVQSELQQLKELEKNHEQHTKDLKKALSDSVESYIKALQSKCSEELFCIDQESVIASEAIQVHKKALKKKVADFNSGLSFSQKAKNCDDNVHKIAMMGQAMVMPPLKSTFPRRIPVVGSRHTLSFTVGEEPKKVPSISHLCGPPLVVKNLESKLKTQGLLETYKGLTTQVQIKTQVLGRSVNGGLSQQISCLGQKTKLSITFFVQPIGQPNFRIIYGGSNFSKELPFSLAVGIVTTEKSWVLTFTPCCNGTHKVHVQIYGCWITADAPTFNVTGELKEGDIVRRTPNSKFTVADLFEDGEDKNLSDYEVGKLTKVERCYQGKSCTSNYKVEVTWGYNAKESKVEELSFIWSEYSGFPLEVVIPAPLPRALCY